MERRLGRKPACIAASALLLAVSQVLYAQNTGPAASLAGNTAPSEGLAQTALAHDFDLPAQPLASMLREIGQRTGTNILFQPGIVRGRESSALRGRLTVDQAIRQLLDGLPFEAQRTSADTIVVRAAAPASGGVRTGQDAAGNGAVRSAAIVPEPGAAQTRQAVPEETDRRPRRAEPAAGAAEVTELERIVVTGTHIRDSAPIGAPLQLYDREAIERSGYGSTEEFMRSLPANLGSVGTNTDFAPEAFAAGNIGFGSAVNLRGLGSDATLVLLDGTRIAPGGFNGAFVDISFVPLGLIERIEVLGDGASATYGSDAVAGVVNYVLREDFDGAETTVRLAGATQGAYEQASLSQAYGRQWDSGGLVLAYHHARDSNLPAGERDFSQDAEGQDLIPEVLSHNAFVNLRQRLSDAVDVSGRAIYSDREVNPTATFDGQPFSTDSRTRQLLTQLSARIALANDWEGLATGSYSWSETRLENMFGSQEGESASSTLGFKADGPLASLPGGELRAAIGAEYRREEITRTLAGQLALSERPLEGGRNVKSLYAELIAPLVSSANERPGIRRLAISAAARYEDYSDFGDVVNPKLGVEWSPVQGLNIRGTVGTSFKAPLLVDLYGSGSVILANVPDPQSAAGTSPALLVMGSNSALDAESSRSWTAGFDWRPPGLPGLKFGLTYFDISYEDRIEPPGRTNDLFALLNFISRPDLNAPFIVRNPSAQAIDAFLANRVLADLTAVPGFGPPRTPADVTVIGDIRLANLASTDVRGMDFDLGYGFTKGLYDWTFNMAGTCLFEKQKVVIAGLPSVVELDTLFNPVDLRLVASANVRRDRVSVNLALNYVDSYENILDTPPQPIDSWTTVDLQLRYDYRNGHVSLGVHNLFDEAPPFIRNNGQPGIAGLQWGYDPTNASPIGRLVSVRLTHQW